ncbi:MAG: hypothetical protein QNK85_09635 [Crocinitomicaceae bacterium]
MSKKRLLSKGWLRLHIVLNCLLAGFTFLSYWINVYDVNRVYWDFGIILALLSSSMYWITVGIVCWIIKGFRDK